MIGKNLNGAILTINDRVSGYVIIEKLNGKDVNELAQKVIARLSPYKAIKKESIRLPPIAAKNLLIIK